MIPVLAKGPDELLPDRPFWDPDLDRDLSVSADLKTVVVNAAPVVCS